MIEWEIVFNKERNQHDLFINGEWYAQGTYEQMEEMKNNYLYSPEDEEYEDENEVYEVLL